MSVIRSGRSWLQRSLFCAGLGVAISVSSPVFALTQEFGFSQILREEALAERGAGYTIKPPVRMSGTLLEYALETEGRTYKIRGTAVLLKRLRELEAMREVRKLDHLSQAGEGVVSAVEKPVKFLGSLFSEPTETLSATADNVGLLLNGTVNAVTGKAGSTARSSAQAQSTTETVAAAVVGRDKARREIAVAANVDPYTTFPPLSEALDDQAWAFATSNRLTNLAGLFIPGAVGSTVSGLLASSNLSAAMKASPTVADEQMRVDLGALGVSEAAAQAFLSSAGMTRGEKIMYTRILQSLASVKGKEPLVLQIGRPGLSQEAGYYYLIGLLMMADYHVETEALASIKMVQGVPVATTRSGRSVAFVAGDRIGWSVEQSNTMLNIATAVNGEAIASGAAELRVYGLVHPQLKQKLQSMNWVIRDKSPLATLQEIEASR